MGPRGTATAVFARSLSGARLDARSGGAFTKSDIVARRVLTATREGDKQVIYTLGAVAEYGDWLLIRTVRIRDAENFEHLK